MTKPTTEQLLAEAVALLKQSEWIVYGECPHCGALRDHGNKHNDDCPSQAFLQKVADQ